MDQPESESEPAGELSLQTLHGGLPHRCVGRRERGRKTTTVVTASSVAFPFCGKSVRDAGWSWELHHRCRRQRFCDD